MTNNLQSPSQFISSRRSYPPAILGAPYPEREEIYRICTSGLRVPDHKKLEPWRLIVLQGESLRFLSTLVSSHAPEYQSDPEKAAKIMTLYQNAGTVIAMVFCPKSDVEGVPVWEQHLSMGAVGVSLVNAAIIEGYGACLMSGFLPDCPEILEYLDINKGEKLSGLVHIGTPTAQSPERPRPNLDQKLKFL